MHLVDRTDLFKISNLDLGGKAIVTSLYSNIERERERERERASRTRAGVHTRANRVNVFNILNF